MTSRPFHPVNDRGQLVRSELQRQARAQEADARRATAGGVLLAQTAGAPLVQGRPLRKIWARITGGSNPYAFQQQRIFLADDGTLDMADHDGGVSGTTTSAPAWEIGGNFAVPQNAVVRLHLGCSNDHWLFDYCCDRDIVVPPPPSGSGSGEGGTPVTVFCLDGEPRTMPRTLYASVTGACSTFANPTVPMYYDEPTGWWIGLLGATSFAGQTALHYLTLVPCGHTIVTASFPDACVLAYESPPSTATARGWRLTYSVFGVDCRAGWAENCTYDPVALDFPNMTLPATGSAACCEDPLTVTITE